ncbi:Glutathione S-transferase 1 [Aphelenchoides avenae]|nr:Glutathione S-transferase 1 [Aphelenchus avenae]
MVNYKLVYFDVRHWAEAARLLLHHEGIPFEDFRFTHAEWPGGFKAQAPFGKVPYLEVDGKKLPESYAINRYLALKFGLAGTDEWEQAWVDAVPDMFKDFMNEAAKYFTVALGHATGNAHKLKSETFNPAIGQLLPILENILNESGSGFVAQSGYTWADFVVVEGLITTENIVPGSVYGNAAVKAYIERVHNIPQIRDYVANRKVALIW